MLTFRDNWVLRVESDDDWHIDTTLILFNKV